MRIQTKNEVHVTLFFPKQMFDCMVLIYCERKLRLASICQVADADLLKEKSTDSWRMKCGLEEEANLNTLFKIQVEYLYF